MPVVFRYIFIVLLISQSAIAQVSGVRQYVFPAEYGASVISAVTRHSKGYFLVGTNNGLYRFDGQKFLPYALAPNCKNSTITAIAEDPTHTVWVGFQSGKIGALKNGTVELFSSEEGYPAVPINAIVADANGMMFFATAGEGIYFYKNKRFYNINTDNGLTDNYVYSLMWNNHSLIAGTDKGINSIAFEANKYSISSCTSSNGLPDNIVRAFIPIPLANKNSGSRYWAGMQDRGIATFSNTTSCHSITPDWHFGQVNSMVISGHQLWVATEENGIVILNFNDQNFSTINAAISYNNGYSKARNLMEDTEGNIWFTSLNKLIKCNGAQLQNIIPLHNDIFKQIHTILVDTKNNIWVNVNNGLLKYSWDSVHQVWQKVHKTLNGINVTNDITTLYEDYFGNIWIGTLGKGIILLNPRTGATRILNEEHLLAGGSILSVSGKEKDIWVSSLGGVAHCTLQPANSNLNSIYLFKDFKDAQSIGSNYIYDIFTDSRGRTWFATDGKGITLLHNNKFINYGKSEGIEQQVIYNICEDVLGNIWFSTLNNGLYRYDGKKFLHFSTSKGLNDPQVTSLASDGVKNIVAVTNKGINIIEAGSLQISYLDANQGIEGINSDLKCISGKGAVYLVDKSGILRYQPTASSPVPVVIINSVQLFLHPIDQFSLNEFSYDENNFTFNYSGISLSHPDKLAYQYKLQGLSNEWMNTRDDKVNFPKLPPGNYTFMVRAAINNQYYSANIASYSFVIKKPFWWQWWFITALAIAGISIIFLLISVREKSLNRWERIEREKVQSQFEALKSQVNPHFLFNSFNTLISIIEDDPAMAVQYVENLSDLYRKIVTHRDKDTISLQEEVEILLNYFFIQHMRFGNYLVFKNEVAAAGMSEVMVAPLTLQLLIENAIKHNAISAETPLTISLYIYNNRLVVKNNINQKITIDKGEGMGLQNITRRYQLLSKEPFIIQNTGKEFIVQIPLLKR